MSAPSAPQLVFEGPDPERLLLEAWSVHGTQVRITEPVTVRRGGILGFFAKAHYRIEVVPGPTPGDPSPRAADAPVEARDEALETVVPSPYGARRMASPPPQEPAPARTLPVRKDPPVPEATPQKTLPAAASAATAQALEDLVAATEDDVDLHSSPPARFDEVLEKVASSLGEDPRQLASALPADPAPPPVASTPAEPARRPVALAERADLEAALADRNRRPPLSAHEGLLEQLELVGFPRDLLVNSPVPPASLLEAFALAPSPRPLPKTPGSLIVVVGSAAVAKGIAAQLGIPPGDVARARRARAVGEQASARLVHDEREAADLAPGWRRDRVGVVAVTVASLLRDGAWARSVLRALAPSMTIALASATTKGEDVRAFCAAIGGADALVVEDLEATLTPAAVLGTGIPVGMLDGMPADPATWVAVATRALARRSGTEA